jgi:hypothetical protein
MRSFLERDASLQLGAIDEAQWFRLQPELEPWDQACQRQGDSATLFQMVQMGVVS